MLSPSADTVCSSSACHFFFFEAGADKHFLFVDVSGESRLFFVVVCVCVCDQLLREGTAVTGVGVASLRQCTAHLVLTLTVAMKHEVVEVKGRLSQISRD